MKIISWNVNGIRSLKSGIKEVLTNLDSDIVCLQETKLSRNQLEETTALVDGYTSYFSFPRHISGYSGVATYCKNSCRPVHAEEGLLGSLNSDNFNQFSLKDDFNLSELLQLENEGRVLITEHSLRCEKEEKLAVINVYCPRADPDRPERKEFKLKFYQILQYRTEQYLKKNYHVVIVGDINTSHKPIDHCDPGNLQEFSEEPARKWLDSFLCKATSSENTETEESGLMVDTFRYFNPDQKGAYTCWNSKTNARMTNYGTRIDYILANKAFLSFMSNSIILPEIQGSDHCPVAASVCCTPIPAEQLPKICTRNWAEFAGRQQTLLGFLQSNCNQGTETVEYSSVPPINHKKSQRLKTQKTITQFLAANKKEKCSESTECNKRQRMLDDNFVGPPDSVSAEQSVQPESQSSVSSDDSEIRLQDANSEKTTDSSCSELYNKLMNCSRTSNPQQKEIWKTLLSGPPPPPLCKGHQEPCVIRTVKREGRNNGRQFFACSKPSGHPSNPSASCNHFEWVKNSKQRLQKT